MLIILVILTLNINRSVDSITVNYYLWSLNSKVANEMI